MAARDRKRRGGEGFRLDGSILRNGLLVLSAGIALSIFRLLLLVNCCHEQMFTHTHKKERKKRSRRGDVMRIVPVDEVERERESSEWTGD